MIPNWTKEKLLSMKPEELMVEFKRLSAMWDNSHGRADKERIHSQMMIILSEINKHGGK